MRPLTPEGLADIKTGAKKIIVGGGVVFDDVFGDERFVTFLGEITHTELELGRVKFADIGNDAS